MTVSTAVPNRYLFLSVAINGTGYLNESWRHRTGGRLDFLDIDHYTRLAELARSGGLDAVFFSDHPALHDARQNRAPHTLDPLIILTAIAARVPDVGLLLTVSSSFNSPYNIARRAATLDVISGGRLIFNVVSSFNPAIAANFGSTPLPPREQRYARANEFIEVVKKLWNSWDPWAGAEASEHVWPPESAHAVDHHGDYFDVAGPLNVPRSKQGHPVVAQAGASDGGIDLAAHYGEIIYTAQLSRQAARAFGETVRTRAAKYGRSGGEIRIIPGFVPIVGRTREEALRRHELLSGAGSEGGLLQRLAQEWGLDASLDPDAPLDPDLFAPKPGQQRPVGFTQAVYELVRDEAISARQLVRRVENGHRLVVGTAEEVADALIEWWQDGTVDGYNIQNPALPDDLQVFIEQVVPILQGRGVLRRNYQDAPTIRDRLGLAVPGNAGLESGAA